ncbi:MAG: UDP-glucose/GDP-mannose dehydrogenase family protein [Chloroflexi bacterium]|nr:UDP-glucose/GDP-mannose dehydrogenase family protein [Chloroflexota bacterium]
MRVTVVGAGYVGLVTGVGLASQGHQVMLVECDKQKLRRIESGEAPFYEDGLETMLQGVMGRNLQAVSSIGEAAMPADIVFFCVQTPCNGNGGMDSTHIASAARDFGKTLRGTDGHPLVVVKSSVVPGTTGEVVRPILEESAGKTAGRDFGLAVNPEFLKEGRALSDFFSPDRIVIGELDRRSGDALSELYGSHSAPVLRTDLKTAEMIKYASNAFLSAKISFMNEIGNICKGLGVDVYRVAEGMGLDPRISPHFLNAGIGFGGSCFPKDTRALAAAAREMGYHPSILDSIISVNEAQPLRLVEIARNKAGDLAGRKVAVLGLAFKPGTDDMREAPSLKIISELLRYQAIVTAYDPMAMENARKSLRGKVGFATSAEDAVREADLVFLVTEWAEFKNPALYRGKQVFDGRRVLMPEEARGLDYEGVCW